MSPIKELSDIRWLPLLGTVRLGIKREKKGITYPEATDYFVVPDEVKAIYGDKPVELKIMFPSDDLNQIAPQALKCYSYSQGLICQGDGTKGIRKVDTNTGDFAGRETKRWALTEAICEPDKCPMVPKKQCRRLMSLLFILYEVPGLGVYRLNTTSFYSIVNMNSQLASDGFLRKFTKGRIAFIPLVLYLKDQVVFPQGEGRKTVHVIDVRADVKLADIIRISRQSAAQVLLPALDEDELPEDLYPEEVLTEANVVQEEESLPASEQPAGEPPAKAKRKSDKQLADEHYREQVEAPVDDIFGEAADTPAEDGAIDWYWLYETLGNIKWNEDTTKSWLHNVLSANIEGSLKEVILGLTQEQKELFFKEIQNRAGEAQPGLL